MDPFARSRFVQKIKLEDRSSGKRRQVVEVALSPEACSRLVHTFWRGRYFIVCKLIDKLYKEAEGGGSGVEPLRLCMSCIESLVAFVASDVRLRGAVTRFRTQVTHALRRHEQAGEEEKTSGPVKEASPEDAAPRSCSASVSSIAAVTTSNATRPAEPRAFPSLPVYAE